MYIENSIQTVFHQHDIKTEIILQSQLVELLISREKF